MSKAVIYICCCLLLLQQGCSPGDELPNMKETYASRETKPFGTYIAKEILQNGFTSKYVQDIQGPFAKASLLFNDTAAVYFSVSRNLYVNANDVAAILDFVYEGNTAFFASANFDSLFMNQLYCKIFNGESFAGYVPPVYKNTASSLIEGIHTSSDSFHYFYKPFESFFTETNNSYCRVVGNNAEGKVNCIVFFWGKGKLFLHCDPRAFSNYFLLTGNNYHYMQELMQVMGSSPQHVYWDEYYYKNNYANQGNKSGSTLSEIFKYPGLKAAFLLLVLMLLLYIVFSIKRKQRVTKVIKPNLNSSVAFTETIARLYLQKHDNKNIAEKMITYFNEFIRNKYYLQVNTGDTDFIAALSRKSGVAEEKTMALFNTINAVNKSEKIDDYQLLSLNEQIQQFYKKRQ